MLATRHVPDLTRLKEALVARLSLALTDFGIDMDPASYIGQLVDLMAGMHPSLLVRPVKGCASFAGKQARCKHSGCRFTIPSARNTESVGDPVPADGRGMDRCGVSGVAVEQAASRLARPADLDDPDKIHITQDTLTSPSFSLPAHIRGIRSV